ncbi:hydantoinase/oxoprolinase family protein [Halovivax cerinus]|uniref:Hydantoinase/oxoprolinase family protein n=1 Tax=Halovivax cerinus TaxID=1487865 RepID=A0ABD5NQL5_9EURY|nr:hydantoinase/oxoprolinase family protein [Halovivax cerinus]
MPDQLAVDIGGTFVDAVKFDPDEGIILEKTPTTPDEPEDGVLTSIDKVGAGLESAESFVHGTTLGINAYLEREGATTGIITNEGHEDVFEIGRINVPREQMYNIQYQKPETLVPRFRRVGVPGRLNAKGEELTPLDEEAVADASRTLVDEHDVESIAVAFLHSYENPAHEKRAAEIIRETVPEVSISVSSDISGELREYERTATTVMDAYIKPIFDSYVDRLSDGLAADGFDGEFFIARSGGGAFSAENAKTAPINTILSGPAGGLIGASYVSNVTSYDDLIAVDMGGTSLDTCVVQDGVPSVSYESSINEMPVQIPVYDIATIGSGGGSIAWNDNGLLRVGPKSAGADPGPICYGEGGTEPTVTDAAVALGYLSPELFLGGEMELAVDEAKAGIEETLGAPLGMSVEEASTGIFEVMFSNTIGAIRSSTVEKGLDPRDFSLFAYGGAGPMVIPSVAREMNAERTIVPQAPSVFSAWGMLMTDVVYNFSQTYMSALADASYDDVQGEFEALEAEGADRLHSEGFDDAQSSFERTAEMRYLGQEHSVEVDADDIADLDALADRFQAEHESRYGHRMEDPPELVHLRVRAAGETEKPAIEGESSGDESAHVGTQEAYCFAREERCEFDLVDRHALSTGDTVQGPAIIKEPTSTVVFHSDQRAEIDAFGQIIITQEDEQ